MWRDDISIADGESRCIIHWGLYVSRKLKMTTVNISRYLGTSYYVCVMSFIL